MAELVFFVAALGAIAGAVGVIVLRNAFYSVLSLVGHLLSLAALFLLLRAEFVAAAQVVVYAGAVMVLYVFVVAYVGVDDDLRGCHELRVQQQEQRREAQQVRHEREHAVERIADGDDPDRPNHGPDRSQEEEHLRHEARNLSGRALNGRVALAAVADLAEHCGGADRGLGVDEQRPEARRARRARSCAWSCSTTGPVCLRLRPLGRSRERLS